MVVTLRFDCRLVLLTATYISIGIAALLMAFPGALVWVPTNSSELAAWVQAVGSIAAIFGAFAVAKWSDIKAKSDAAEEAQLRAQLSVIPVVSRLRTSALKLSQLNSNLAKYPSLNTKRQIQRLSEILRYVHLPNSEVIYAVASVDIACANAMSIAAESLRQLQEHIDFELRFDDDPSTYTRGAMLNLIAFLDVNTNFASDGVVKFLSSRGVPLYGGADEAPSDL